MLWSVATLEAFRFALAVQVMGVQVEGEVVSVDVGRVDDINRLGHSYILQL